MTTLTRIGTGRYRHDRLGVEIEKTAARDLPWQLYSANAEESGVVFARTLGAARALLREIESRVDQEPQRVVSLERLALGEAVRFERERAEINVAAFALKIGASAKRVEALEAGRLDPDFELLMSLPRALGLRPTDLFRRAARLAVGDREPAERVSSDDAAASLLALHRYLYPERYAEVPTYEWHAGTIEEVAEMLERALANHPDARLEPR